MPQIMKSRRSTLIRTLWSVALACGLLAVPLTAITGTAQAEPTQNTASRYDGEGNFAALPSTPSSTWARGSKSGSFAWSYAMRVPAASSRLQPKVAIDYDSSVVDRRTPITNLQSSSVGEGFSLKESYVQRGYMTCADDGQRGKRDLCWKNDNATLVVDGVARRLVKLSTNSWRLSPNDGSRFVRLTGGPAGNKDNDKEYWRLTRPNGVRYYFGYSVIPGKRGETKSVWWVPVAGDDSGDKCHRSTFASSFCNQGWRWNLDYVVDAKGNTISYYYTPELNRYAKNGSKGGGVHYVRGGHLSRIDYGTRASQRTSARHRVTFTTANRCLHSSCPYTRTRWRDTPYEFLCASTRCGNRTAPTFFTRKRLSMVKTMNLVSGSYQTADRWILKHKMYNSSGGGSSTYPWMMWPETITHTPYVAGSSRMPQVTLRPAYYPHHSETSSDGVSSSPRILISSIKSDGRSTLIGFSTDSCRYPRPVPSKNTKRCYPVRWKDSHGAITTYWVHRWTLSHVTSEDARRVQTTTYYSYRGGRLWSRDANPLLRSDYRTWSIWRGYTSVRTREAAGN